MVSFGKHNLPGDVTSLKSAREFFSSVFFGYFALLLFKILYTFADKKKYLAVCGTTLVVRNLVKLVEQLSILIDRLFIAIIRLK